MGVSHGMKIGFISPRFLPLVGSAHVSERGQAKSDWEVGIVGRILSAPQSTASALKTLTYSRRFASSLIETSHTHTHTQTTMQTPEPHHVDSCTVTFSKPRQSPHILLNHIITSPPHHRRHIPSYGLTPEPKCAGGASWVGGLQ